MRIKNIKLRRTFSFIKEFFSEINWKEYFKMLFLSNLIIPIIVFVILFIWDCLVWIYSIDAFCSPDQYLNIIRWTIRINLPSSIVYSLFLTYYIW